MNVYPRLKMFHERIILRKMNKVPGSRYLGWEMEGGGMIGYVVKHLCNILSFLSKKKFTGKKKDFFSQIPVLNLKLHLLNFTVFLSE